MGFSKDVMHIVYASDDKFAEIMGVSLVSLYHNNMDMKEINVYVLDSGISYNNKNKINSISKKYNRNTPIYINLDIGKRLKISVNTDRGSLSQYARLFISSFLPNDIDRVLTLDCDVIINAPLNELWNLNIKNNTVAAIMDAFSRHYRPNIGLESSDIMFNPGVMIIDMNRWKINKVENKLIKFILEKRGIIQQSDLGVLNAVLSHDTYCIAPKFNAETVFFDFNYKELMIFRAPPYYYSYKEIKDAIEHPVIIHFTTSFLSERPWVVGCDHRYAKVWRCYKKMSPWKDKPLWKPEKGKKSKKIYAFLANAMPRCFVIRISGLLHRYGRPLIYKVKNI